MISLELFSYVKTNELWHVKNVTYSLTNLSLYIYIYICVCVCVCVCKHWNNSAMWKRMTSDTLKNVTYSLTNLSLSPSLSLSVYIYICVCVCVCVWVGVGVCMCVCVITRACVCGKSQNMDNGFNNISSLFSIEFINMTFFFLKFRRRNRWIKKKEIKKKNEVIKGVLNTLPVFWFYAFFHLSFSSCHIYQNLSFLKICVRGREEEFALVYFRGVISNKHNQIKPMKQFDCV